MRILLTDFEKSELTAYADACALTGRRCRARFVRSVASHKYRVMLCHYDKIMAWYRNWLVFNQF